MMETMGLGAAMGLAVGLVGAVAMAEEITVDSTTFYGCVPLEEDSSCNSLASFPDSTWCCNGDHYFPNGVPAPAARNCFPLSRELPGCPMIVTGNHLAVQWCCMGGIDVEPPPLDRPFAAECW